ncbi:ras-like family member 11 [Holotrichia oblita]|uniref:Ras-like family member 11 n=1 Tax=Holotrichia oblita TaxID=644536 RepID=A0ACB9TVS4_HOLOL|nr:ras-like family member 11 [Holotrichia oblita]
MVRYVNLQEQKSTTFREDVKASAVLTLPYAPFIIRGLSKIFKELDLRIVYSSETSLRSFIDIPKDKIQPLEKSDIYEINCKDCNQKYIGQPTRVVSTRFKEHMNEDDFPSSDTLNWADGILLVYSITDRRSFAYVKKVSASFTDNDVPIYLVANKNDMVHLRQVSAEEGTILAREMDCGFSEVAAAEQVAPIASVFQDLCRAVLAARRKSKHSLLERMLGAKGSNIKLYARGKSDSALPKD